MSQDHFATKIKILNRQTKFHETLSTSWKWIHSKFIIFAISETWFMQIFRHHSTTVKLSQLGIIHLKKLFYANFKKRKRRSNDIIYIFHDSMGSISSKLELNDPNHHALSQIKVHMLWALKSCSFFWRCNLECWSSRGGKKLFSINYSNFLLQMEIMNAVFFNFHIRFA